MPNKIMLVAGEASGDSLGANLALELKKLQVDIKLSAMGGEQMRQAGVDIIVDNQKMDIIGWLGVLKNLIIIIKAWLTIKKIFESSPPDLLILIDYPGFNLRLAKLAKKYGIKVLYYVSPQIWAWKYGRIETIRQYVDHIAVLFKFEEQIYRQENIPVTFVGHPLARLVHPTENKKILCSRYGFNPEFPVIALFPGSRKQEIQRLLPVIVAAIQIIKQSIPHAQFALPLASTLQEEDLRPYLTQDIILVKNDTYNLLSICTAAIVKSGTSTLETALSQTPLLIIYKGNFLNYWIARTVVKVTQIGLCNIVAQESLAKEFIQYDVTPENIAAETIHLITDADYRHQILSKLATLKANMTAESPNSRQVAAIALNL